MAQTGIVPGDEAENEAQDLREPAQAGRGRQAEAPHQIPIRGLKDVFWRVVHEVSDDRVTLIAAGVTFYMLLALFPALGALVSLYGIIADPQSIGASIGFLNGMLPAGTMDIILNQLGALTAQKTSSLSIGFLVGLGVALWSAHNGTLAVFDAMNVAYNEKEKRSFLKLTLMSFAFTIGFLVIAMVLVALIGVLPAVLAYLWLDRWTELLARTLRWPFLLVLVSAAVVMVYRFGPSRERAKLPWLTWGAAFATLAWLVASLGYSYYIDNFADYNATYGTLGALIGFMIWTWISVIILIVGAEINAELEHQTARDTTTGAERPLGQRGAYVADTVGRSMD
ncbi:ribonuclease [Rhizobium rhizosphaerae]|uniref:Ribonuclease n=1 Tax=Xaviernesmea rhizosphaerae TaxID=1672749 RepID=A0A1Q9AQC3_9HYPH|nr:YihY/virulence factor BrkB family protein [Xaviernesmea rhizosphaerae]OLP57623.1 ribonuclease [Xaviernesmea rhizosphaerae]